MPGLETLGTLLVMGTSTVSLPMDEELVRRARQQDAHEAEKTDAQVVADALTVYLGWRALDAARARGTLDEDEAERVAVEELHALRRERRNAI